jgi:hypothetical protein
MDREVDVNGCAIHMRWGDYDDSYHPTPKIEYYREALNHVEGPFFLFSDNLDKSNELMKDIPIQYIPVTMNYLESFKMMKRCRHFICGNSSYSLMAAILADHPEKIVVCPKKWFGDHVGLETIDLYPEGSIII